MAASVVRGTAPKPVQVIADEPCPVAGTEVTCRKDGNSVTMKKAYPMSFTTGVHGVDDKIEKYAENHAPLLPGTQIYTLGRLAFAAECKLSVVCPSSGIWVKPRPAAFVIHLSGYILNRMINAGMFIYRKGSNGKF